jgi:hypothetical protein
MLKKLLMLTGAAMLTAFTVATAGASGELPGWRKQCLRRCAVATEVCLDRAQSDAELDVCYQQADECRASCDPQPQQP